MSDLRHWINLVESTKKRMPKVPTSKLTPYEVVRYNGPKNQSSTILDKTVIHATNRDELQRKIKDWMEQINLDPEDEDDLNTVSWWVC